jgi:hypothetical protein
MPAADLVLNGSAAAQAFLESWDWDAFRRVCPDVPTA